MAPQEIEIFNARLRFEQSLRGGVNGLNPVDPVLNLEAARNADSGIGSTEIRKQSLETAKANLQRTLNFSPNQSGITDYPSTSTSSNPYAKASQIPQSSQQLQQTTGGALRSVGANIGLGLARAGSGAVGSLAGSGLARSVYGQKENGLGANIGSVLGGLIGGGLGGTALGASTLGVGTAVGSVLGAGLGSAIGGFLGGTLDKIASLFGQPTPSRSPNSVPSADRGNAYTRNPNAANSVYTPPFTGGQCSGVQYALKVTYRRRDSPTVLTTFTGASLFGKITEVGISDIGVFLRNDMGQIDSRTIDQFDSNGLTIFTVFIEAVGGADNCGDLPNPNPVLNLPPNAVNPFVPNNPTPSESAGSGQPIDVLEDGEEYILGTGFRKPKAIDPTPQLEPIRNPQVSPNPVIPSVTPNPNSGIGASTGGANSSSPSTGSSSGSEALGSSNKGLTARNQSQNPNPFSGAKPAYESPAYSSPAYASPAFASPAFSAKPFVSGVSNPDDYGKEIDINTGKERKTTPNGTIEPVKTPNVSPTQTPKPVSTPIANPPSPIRTTPEPKTPTNDLLPLLGQIAAITAGLTALKLGSDLLVNNSLNNTPKINQIANNTTPIAQQTNAKQGVCDAMQPSQCGFEGVKQATTEATNPIKDQTVANAGLLANIISAIANLATLIAQLATNLLKPINAILNNQFVHGALTALTTFTVIHNAAMLSRDIGQSLGGAIDNGLNLFGQVFKNSEGETVTFTDFIGANTRALIVNIIGEERYLDLVSNWQKANTIYHSAMGVLNTTQSMLDPLSSAIEYGMENVSKIGNSLKEDGVVSENSYPAMDETIRARRVNRFERLNDTLEGAENIASNLSSVTSSAVSVKEDYKQLREDSKQFKDKVKEFSDDDIEARAELKASLQTDITSITLAPAPVEDEAP